MACAIGLCEYTGGVVMPSSGCESTVQNDNGRDKPLPYGQTRDFRVGAAPRGRPRANDVRPYRILSYLAPT